jgi:hypothetical protein
VLFTELGFDIERTSSFIEEKAEVIDGFKYKLSKELDAHLLRKMDYETPPENADHPHLDGSRARDLAQALRAIARF